jgi:hypothetical protein
MRALRAGGTAAICSLLLVSAASDVHASSVVIPDDLPTIQQGIDSGADTVYVADGTYAEDLVATAPVVLLPKIPQGGLYQGLPLPIVGSLTTSAHLTVRSFRFTGLVTLEGTIAQGQLVRFEACRFDAGMITTGRTFWSFLHVLGCTFLGDADVIPYSGGFANNAFIGAHLYIRVEGTAAVISNVFTGSGAYAIRAAGEQGSARIAWNTISGGVNGILLESLGGDVHDNEVSGCSGAGIRESVGGGGLYHRNRIRDCGAHGFELTGSVWGPALVENVIENVGGDGIHNDGMSAYLLRDNEVRFATGRGIFAISVAHEVTGNLVLDSGADGISIGSATRVDSNVVGRAGGRGIHVADHESHWIGALRHNTAYQCAGAGIELGGQPDSILNNIAYANGGVGFTWTGAGTPVLACNDWFANAGGATSGVAPGPTDLAVDPQFCNLAQDDVHLSAASPLLDAVGCGQIGALGEGCSVAVSLGPAETDGEFRLDIHPRPTRGGVTFAWTNSMEPTHIEVFDVTGARRWAMTAAPGAARMDWGLEDAAGRRLPPGVYLARLKQGGKVVSDKLVLAP